MPGMQFIGQEPEKRNLLAEAMEKGAGGFVKGMEYGQARQEKQEERKLEFEKVDWQKRKDTYDMMIKAGELLDESSATRMFSEPIFQQLESSLGMPHIVDTEGEGKVGYKQEKEKVPTWNQAQELEGVKSDIKRKRGTVSDIAGQMIPFEMKTVDDAMDYISRKQLDPSLFADVLKESFGEGGEGTVQVGKGKDKYKVGEKRNVSGVTWTYLGNNKWQSK